MSLLLLAKYKTNNFLVTIGKQANQSMQGLPSDNGALSFKIGVTFPPIQSGDCERKQKDWDWMFTEKRAGVTFCLEVGHLSPSGYLIPCEFPLSFHMVMNFN